MGGKKRAEKKSIPLKSYYENIVSEIGRKGGGRALRRWRMERKCVARRGKRSGMSGKCVFVETEKRRGRKGAPRREK